MSKYSKVTVPIGYLHKPNANRTVFSYTAMREEFCNNYRKMHGLPMKRRVSKRKAVITRYRHMKHKSNIFNAILDQLADSGSNIGYSVAGPVWCSTYTPNLLLTPNQLRKMLGIDNSFVMGIDLAEGQDWCCGETVWRKDNPYLCFGIPLIDQNKVVTVELSGEEKSDE